jgi:NAD(P)-dependent dehydrogenase (short-subunit alcohol dehydrogenase family)
MLCCKHAIPDMLKRGGGSIVNISSGAALSGQLGIPAYSAAKAAVIALTRSVATLYGQKGIRCNAIAPGLILHERLAEIFPIEQIRIDAENILTPRAGTPEDIAATVIFLASDQARFINAQVLPVDGGLLAHTPTYAQTRAMGSKRLEVKERS